MKYKNAIIIICLIFIALVAIFFIISDAISDDAKYWFWVIIIFGYFVISVYDEIKKILKQDNVLINKIQLILSSFALIIMVYSIITNSFAIYLIGVLTILKHILALIIEKQKDNI